MHKTFYKLALTISLTFLVHGSANNWSTHQVLALPLQTTDITTYVRNVQVWTSSSQHSIQVSCPPPPYGCW